MLLSARLSPHPHPTPTPSLIQIVFNSQEHPHLAVQAGFENLDLLIYSQWGTPQQDSQTVNAVALRRLLM